MDKEAAAAYDCIIGDMLSAYAKSGHAAASYASWRRYNVAPYQSATHGSRYVSNYANAVGRAYGNFEEAGIMPVGTVLAKDSFVVTMAGGVGVGPLFLMEKMEAGFNADSGDWRYTLIQPDGSIFGTTNGKGSNNVAFCYECHMGAEDTDSLLFMPDEVRAP